MSVQLKKLKVLIAAGGTGGHVFPGIAIAEELRRVNSDVQIRFVGTDRGLETKILPKEGWPLLLMKSSPLKGQSAIMKFAAVARLPFSVVRAMLIMISEHPHILVSIGGYAAAPLSIAAWLMRVPCLLVEPNAIPGMTNLKLARLSRKVFVAFDETQKRFAPGKAVLTGVPVRQNVLETRRTKAKDGRTAVFLFGGSQGAVRLNKAMVGAMVHMRDLTTSFSVIHQAGENDNLDSIVKAYKDLGVEAEVFAFTDRIWECYSRADIVIGRSGANTIAEVTALGLASILVPYPYAADDHQRANAEWLVKEGGAAMILDSECTGERLAKELRTMIEDNGRMATMAARAADVGRPDAAKKIVEECLKIVNRES